MSNLSDTNSALDIILEELAKYGGQQKTGTSYRLVVCPFHSDSSPSLSINLSKPGFKVGTFNCWSCPASGSWNKFAEKTGLRKIKDWQNKEQTISEISADDEAHLMGFRSETDYATSLGVDVITDWFPNKSWRGFSGKLLARIGAKLAIDRVTNDPVLLCPVIVNKKKVGYVKALLEKKQGRLAYVSSKGPWTKNTALFPFDYVKAKIRKMGFVILVEGPRDALRLITAGLPALAILGVQNFGDKKALILASLGIDIYVMPDNDEAGITLYKKAKESFKKLGISIKHIKLPKKKDKQGRIIKMDPCSAPDEVINTLKEQLEDYYNGGAVR
jgi:5S rRNA maturation endonuclease (ribonuclease M5)